MLKENGLQRVEALSECLEEKIYDIKLNGVEKITPVGIIGVCSIVNGAINSDFYSVEEKDKLYQLESKLVLKAIAKMKKETPDFKDDSPLAQLYNELLKFDETRKLPEQLADTKEAHEYLIDLAYTDFEARIRNSDNLNTTRKINESSKQLVPQTWFASLNEKREEAKPSITGTTRDIEELLHREVTFAYHNNILPDVINARRSPTVKKTLGTHPSFQQTA